MPGHARPRCVEGWPGQPRSSAHPEVDADVELEGIAPDRPTSSTCATDAAAAADLVDHGTGERMTHRAHQHPQGGRLPDAGRVGAARATAGWSGPSAPTTGAWAASRRRRRSPGRRGHREHEPLTMVVSAAQYVNARERLPCRRAGGRDDHRRLVDARHRPDVRGQRRTASCRGVDWQFNAWGGLGGRALLPVGRRRPGRPQGARAGGRASGTTPTSSSRAGRSTSTARARCSPREECLLNHNRNPELTSEQIERTCASTSASTRSSGCRAGCTSTRPTATSTTSPGSPPPAS